jgi:hypothetical protein
MNLYETLAQNQAQTPFVTSSESTFFADHSFLLADVDQWHLFLKPTDSFMTIRANIILRALLNKSAIEHFYLSKLKTLKENPSEEELSLDEFMKEEMSILPYLNYLGKKIYVPIFPESLNTIYSGQFAKLTVSPYKRLLNDYQAAAIDPFDYYGYHLFDSYFTKLVPIRTTPTVLAAYDYDAETLYFINDQGRLDAKICFFDKELGKAVKTHMVKRIEAVADAYLANDRNGLITALVRGNLVSSSLMHKIAGKEIRFAEKSEKKKEDA